MLRVKIHAVCNNNNNNNKKDPCSLKNNYGGSEYIFIAFYLSLSNGYSKVYKEFVWEITVKSYNNYWSQLLLFFIFYRKLRIKFVFLLKL